MRQLPRPGRIGWIHPDQPRGIPVWEWGTARRTVISGLCGPLVAPFTASSSLRSRTGWEQAAIRPVFTRGGLPAPRHLERPTSRRLEAVARRPDGPLLGRSPILRMAGQRADTTPQAPIEPDRSRGL